MAEGGKKRLGELLLETGTLQQPQLEAALAEQKRLGCRLGTLLVARGLVADDVLAKFLSYQLDAPSVNLAEINVPSAVTERLPRTLQEKHLAVPIAIREDSREVLVVAMADPTDVSALDEIAFVTGCAIDAVVATEGAIRQALGLQSAQEVVGTGATESAAGADPGDNPFAGPSWAMDSVADAPLGQEAGVSRGRLEEPVVELDDAAAEAGDLDASVVGGSGYSGSSEEPSPGYLGTEGVVADLPDEGAAGPADPEPPGVSEAAEAPSSNPAPGPAEPSADPWEAPASPFSGPASADAPSASPASSPEPADTEDDPFAELDAALGALSPEESPAEDSAGEAATWASDPANGAAGPDEAPAAGDLWGDDDESLTIPEPGDADEFSVPEDLLADSSSEPADSPPDSFEAPPAPAESAGQLPSDELDVPHTDSSERSASVDRRLLKRVKLLEAVAELLIQKGLVSEDEIREHLRKGHDSDD